MASYGPEVKQLLRRIREAGYSSGFVRRMIPDWWSEEVETEPGAVTELKIRLARRLGLDLSALLESGSVALSVPQGVKFKRAVRSEELALNEPSLAYCRALAQSIAAMMKSPSLRPLEDAASERAEILVDDRVKWISLKALLRRCWEDLGIAVVEVAALPGSAKTFDAVTFCVDGRYVVILAKKTPHPAWASFIVAHELSHIALGHVGEGEAIVDETLSAPERPALDQEERDADAYALSLLGGEHLKSVRTEGSPNPGSLAKSALAAGAELRVDPGHLILRFARESNQWDVAQAALALLFDGSNVAVTINEVANKLLDFSLVGEDSQISVTEALIIES